MVSKNEKALRAIHIENLLKPHWRDDKRNWMVVSKVSPRMRDRLDELEKQTRRG